MFPSSFSCKNEANCKLFVTKYNKFSQTLKNYNILYKSNAVCIKRRVQKKLLKAVRCEIIRIQAKISMNFILIKFQGLETETIQNESFVESTIRLGNAALFFSFEEFSIQLQKFNIKYYFIAFVPETYAACTYFMSPFHGIQSDLQESN